MSDIRPAFLLSLPRSGSTLLQRIVGAHSHVATVAEPWLLIPPLYALREAGVFAEYGHRTLARAIDGLCRQLPDGRSDYLQAVAAMARDIYGRLSPPDTRVFLDKTPRYGLIVDELLAAFPDAAFLVLNRNPLAVIASIIETFSEGRWTPYHHKQDLYLLADRLLSAQERKPEAFTAVRFEDVLTDPEVTVRRLIEALGLEWEDRVLDSFTEVSVAGNVGDRTGVEAYDHLSMEPLEKWHQQLASPIRRAWARRYLRWLGTERLELMGYRLEELLGQLERISVDNSRMPGDLVSTAKGVVWSMMEVESTRVKLRNFPTWRETFTHT